MDKPLVSIIIPLYNAEKYIAATIQSALNQTWANKEIIVVDDGSTDNSFAITNQFGGENIRVITGENKGASAARNIGLKEAKGEYIQFLDADDLLSEDKIAAQMEVLLKSPGYVGLCGTVHFQDGDDPFSGAKIEEWYIGGSDNPVDFLTKLYGGAIVGPQYGGMIQPNAWLTPMNLITKAGWWNEMRNPDDDGEFFCRVLLASKGVRYVATGTNYYRKFITGDSWSAHRSYEASNNILKSTLLKAQYLLARTNEPMVKEIFSLMLWENAFSCYPYFKDLSLTAQQKAEELAPDYKYNPYKNGLPLFLSKITGWKTVKYLQYLKHKNK